MRGIAGEWSNTRCDPVERRQPSTYVQPSTCVKLPILAYFATDLMQADPEEPTWSIEYEDGDSEELDLRGEKWKFTPGTGDSPETTRVTSEEENAPLSTTDSKVPTSLKRERPSESPQDMAKGGDTHQVKKKRGRPSKKDLEARAAKAAVSSEGGKPKGLKSLKSSNHVDESQDALKEQPPNTTFNDAAGYGKYWSSSSILIACL